MDSSTASSSLDIAQEDRPNPTWLRNFAGTLKLERDLLRGHRIELPEPAASRARDVEMAFHRAALAALDLAETLDPRAAAAPTLAEELAGTIADDQHEAARDDARGEADR